MSAETILVTDTGFAAPDPASDAGFITAADLSQSNGTDLRVDLPPDANPAGIAPHFDRIGMIRIGFPGVADGRGFTLARELRRRGFRGRIRAFGHLICDQYRLARSCGFDEAEIPADLAARQPEHLWVAPARLGYLDLLT